MCSCPFELCNYYRIKNGFGLVETIKPLLSKKNILDHFGTAKSILGKMNGIIAFCNAF